MQLGTAEHEFDTYLIETGDVDNILLPFNRHMMIGNRIWSILFEPDICKI